jgi:hypothetical protein
MLIDVQNRSIQVNRVVLKPAGMMIVIAVALSGCASSGSLNGFKWPFKNRQAQDVITPEMRPKDQGSQQNLGHITVADAAKVTDAELEQAVVKPAARPEQNLGTTIASLGLLDKSGFWLETPLVESQVDGRVVYLKNGMSINLRLIPNGTTAGSGSQISAAAMQILGIPIVDLAELQVFIR